MNKIKFADNNHILTLVWIISSYLGVMVGCASAFAANTSTADVMPSAATTAAIAQAGVSTTSGSAQAAGIEKKSKKAGKSTTSGKKQSEPIFARVNGKPITVNEYNSLYAQTIQQRFYHGNVPEGEAAAVHKEVTDELVLQILLADEAARRGIVPDPAMFERVLADYDARYGSDPDWQQKREQVVPDLKLQVGRSSMVEQVVAAIRDVPLPTTAEARAYYEQKPELFTEPEKLRLSIILLKVDPSSPNEVWNKAREQAQGIYDRIKGGADFAKEARLHSAHDSADNGGDMGYLHGGMLSQGLQEKIDQVKVGEVSEPIKLLEGMSLYRVEDRVLAKLQEFSAVEKRAQELLERDRKSQAWSDTIRRLRATAKIKFFTSSVSGDAGKLPRQKK